MEHKRSPVAGSSDQGLEVIDILSQDVETELRKARAAMQTELRNIQAPSSAPRKSFRGILHALASHTSRDATPLPSSRPDARLQSSASRSTVVIPSTPAANATVYHSSEEEFLDVSHEQVTPRPNHQIIRLTPEDFASQRPQFLRQSDEDCMRCGRPHIFVDDLCTRVTDILGRECPFLSKEEQEYRESTKQILKLNQNVSRSRASSTPDQQAALTWTPQVVQDDSIAPTFTVYQEPRHCQRCHFEHKFSHELCTRLTAYDGQICPPLPSQVLRHRWNTKYELDLITRAEIPEEHQIKPSPLCAKCDGYIEQGIPHSCKLNKKYFDEALKAQSQDIQARKQRDLNAINEQNIAFGLTRAREARELIEQHVALTKLPGPVYLPGKLLRPAAAMKMAHLSASFSKQATDSAPMHDEPARSFKQLGFHGFPPQDPADHQSGGERLLTAKEIRSRWEASQASQAKAEAEQKALSEHTRSKLTRSIAQKTKSLAAEQAQLNQLIAGQIPVEVPAAAVPAARPSRRALEKKQALATADKDEQRQLKFSRTIKAEVKSEDDEEEINVELKASVAHHNLFNPTQKLSKRTKDKYVKSDFIDDDEEEEVPGEDSPAEDSDPDYTPGSSPSPSPKRKSKTSRPEKEGVTLTMDEYRALMAQLNPSQKATTDQHGRKLDGADSRLVAKQDAPPHGTWNDIHHLMTTFSDQYEMYRRRCGKGAQFESIWECYMPTQQENIIKHLNITDPTREKPFDRDFMELLTNDALKQLLCNTMGINYQHETLKQLQLHRLEGSYLTSSNWVVLQTKWEQVLRRCTPQGELLPKALTKHFINSISNPFIRTWLFDQDKKTWTDAFDAIVSAIDNPHWLKSYQLDRETKLDRTDAANGGAANGGAANGGAGAAGAAPAVPKTPKQAKPAAVEPQGDFNPLLFKNKSGKINVNPNLKKKMPDANPNKDECVTCIYVHNFDMNLCTSERTKTGEACPPLAKDEVARRLFKRWTQGHFFATIPEQIKHLLMPTPASAAAAAAITVANLAGGK